MLAGFEHAENETKALINFYRQFVYLNYHLVA